MPTQRAVIDDAIKQGLIKNSEKKAWRKFIYEYPVWLPILPVSIPCLVEEFKEKMEMSEE